VRCPSAESGEGTEPASGWEHRSQRQGTPDLPAVPIGALPGKGEPVVQLLLLRPVDGAKSQSSEAPAPVIGRMEQPEKFVRRAAQAAERAGLDFHDHRGPGIGEQAIGSAQRTELTTAQRDILTKLGIDPPKKIIELGPPPAT